MFKRGLFKQILLSVALILVGMLFAWVFSGGAGQLLNLGGSPSAQAAASLPSATLRSDSAPGAPVAVWHTCTSEKVAAYANRIHVRCSNPAPGGIYFFALGTTHSSHAARVLSILSMAHVTGKQLAILYDPTDTSGSAIGCQVGDCRLIQSAEILP